MRPVEIMTAAHDYGDRIEPIGRRAGVHRHCRADNAHYAGDIHAIAGPVVDLVGGEAEYDPLQGVGLKGGGDHAHD